VEGYRQRKTASFDAHSHDQQQLGNLSLLKVCYCLLHSIITEMLSKKVV